MVLTEAQKAQIKEISNCMDRIKEEQEAIKDIIKDLDEATGAGKKAIRSAARMYNKGNRTEIEAEFDKASEIYTAVNTAMDFNHSDDSSVE